MISLEYALRTEGLPTLDFWEQMMPVVDHRSHDSKSRSPGRPGQETPISPGRPGQTEARKPERLCQLIVCEDNEAVIKIIMKGRSTALRHISRTHRINIDWMYERIDGDQVCIRHVPTKDQVADMLTKGSFKEMLWNHLMSLTSLGPGSERHVSVSISTFCHMSSLQDQLNEYSAGARDFFVCACQDFSPAVACASSASLAPDLSSGPSSGPFAHVSDATMASSRDYWSEGESDASQQSGATRTGQHQQQQVPQTFGGAMQSGATRTDTAIAAALSA